LHLGDSDGDYTLFGATVDRLGGVGLSDGAANTVLAALSVLPVMSVMSYSTVSIVRRHRATCSVSTLVRQD
jgi:hypothetical protein